MLEGRGHAVDLWRSEAKLDRLLSPRRQCLANLRCYIMRLIRAEFEIRSDFERQLQRGGPVFKIDRGRQDSPFNIRGHRIEVIGR